MQLINRKSLLIVIIILICTNGILAIRYHQLKQTSAQQNNQIAAKNKKILDFTNLFITEVLQSNQVVDFQTRLKLENEIRDINDPELLKQWQTFVDSKTQDEAQKETTNLLKLLITKAQTTN